MVEDNGNWKVLILMRLNYKKWFRLMEVKHEEKVLYILFNKCLNNI